MSMTTLSMTTISTLSMTTLSPIYIPSFNPENGKYEDTCPIPPRSRIEHRCMCNHKGTLFYTPTQFKSHIKLKKHIYYVEHYIENIKELDQSLEQNKKLQTDYELMYRRLTNEIKFLKNRVSELEK